MIRLVRATALDNAREEFTVDETTKTIKADGFDTDLCIEAVRTRCTMFLIPPSCFPRHTISHGIPPKTERASAKAPT